MRRVALFTPYRIFLPKYVCHAEVNAILNKNTADVRGCSVSTTYYCMPVRNNLADTTTVPSHLQIYVALFPCNECAKLIIQSGITEVVYLSDKYQDTPSMQASRRMLTMAGVSYVDELVGLCSLQLLTATIRMQVKLRQFTPSQTAITIDFSQIQPRPDL
jgi:pyrimidine deaminase RibD-like protein